MADEEQIIEYRDPPAPIRGVAYDRLTDDRICQECGRCVLAGQHVIRRNARGRFLSHVLPAKNGICINCGADFLSAESIVQYESVLKQMKNYETLREAKQLTDRQELDMKLLEHNINELQKYVNELSDFVKFSEESGVKYYDDQIEGDDDE